jgi:YfiH family protein
VTTRVGGASEGVYDSLNFGLHVGDSEAHVARNRQMLQRQCGLPAAPVWLTQVHGTRVHLPDRLPNPTPAEQSTANPIKIEADAAFCQTSGHVLAIMVADCLPVLICSRDGQEIAALHAGWRGLALGIIEQVVARFDSNELIAWMGPAIGPCHYEVDAQVRSRFKNDTGFEVGRDPHHWMLNLYTIACQQLQLAGVSTVSGGGECTFCDPAYYSYRRDGVTGRMATLIWRD